MTNTEKAQQILDVLRSEIAQATDWLNGNDRRETSYRDLPGRITEAAAASHALGARYAEVSYSALLAEELGDITTDATDEDADSIIETAIEHLTEARLTANADPTPPVDRFGLANYVSALTRQAAAQRFVEIVSGILQAERPEAQVAGETLYKLRRIVERRSALDKQRDELVRALMPIRSVPRKDIAEAADLSEPRLYQIRDGRR